MKPIKLTMKPQFEKIAIAFIGICFSFSLYAQTAGTLTFTFTPVSHTGYSGTKNVLAIWIQSSTGTFVKTKLRRAGSGTSDHLPTFAVNAGGTAGNCLSAATNTVSATTGATLTTFTAKSITWDGTNVSGVQVPDGSYRVAVEECWNHGTTAKTVRYFNFTKGPNSDIQTPANDANFTGISLQWIPTSTVGLQDLSAEANGVSIFPNPSNDGLFTINFQSSNNIKVINTLGVTVYDEKIESGENSKNIDLSTLANGVYIVYVIDGNKSTKHKIIINK